MARLTREDILEGWTLLGKLAEADGRSIDLLVVGGAVMTVHFRSRDATEDVDGIFEPAPETRQYAAAVAEEKGWAEDWLNDGAKGYVSTASYGPVLYEGAGIRVRSVSVEQLLALKLMAWRDDVDFGDAERLLRDLRERLGADVASQGKLLELLAPYIIEHYAQKASYALEELWELAPPNDDVR